MAINILLFCMLKYNSVVSMMTSIRLFGRLRDCRHPHPRWTPTRFDQHYRFPLLSLQRIGGVCGTLENITMFVVRRAHPVLFRFWFTSVWPSSSVTIARTALKVSLSPLEAAIANNVCLSLSTFCINYLDNAYGGLANSTLWLLIFCCSVC